MNDKKPATILNGKELAEKIKLEIKKKTATMKQQPGLAAILVGDSAASQLYIKLKEKACLEVGIIFHKYLCNSQCCSNISEPELLELINFLNRDQAVDGILIQLPLPDNYDPDKIIKAINPAKDVDGFHPQNKTGIIPPTVGAVLELLKATGENLTDKSTLIIGNSEIFLAGLEKYLKKELKIKKIKTSLAIGADVKKYEIIIIALGQALALKKSMVQSGAIVIDIGINQVGDKTVGDVAEDVRETAAFISPVPGGVGPLTVACLLRNTLELALKKIKPQN